MRTRNSEKICDLTKDFHVVSSTDRPNSQHPWFQYILVVTTSYFLSNAKSPSSGENHCRLQSKQQGLEGSMRGGQHWPQMSELVPHPPVLIPHGSSCTYSKTQSLKPSKWKDVCLNQPGSQVCHLDFFFYQTGTPTDSIRITLNLFKDILWSVTTPTSKQILVVLTRNTELYCIIEHTMMYLPRDDIRNELCIKGKTLYELTSSERYNCAYPRIQCGTFRLNATYCFNHRTYSIKINEISPLFLG